MGVRGLYHINPDWALGATYITKMKPINSPSFEGMYELAGVDEKEDGVMSLGTRYRYREGGELGFIAYHADDMINIVYSEFDHKFGFDGDKGFRLGFQYSHQGPDVVRKDGFNGDVDGSGEYAEAGLHEVKGIRLNGLCLPERFCARGRRLRVCRVTAAGHGGNE